jgi:hypothetical protein
MKDIIKGFLIMSFCVPQAGFGGRHGHKLTKIKQRARAIFPFKL